MSNPFPKQKKEFDMRAVSVACLVLSIAAMLSFIAVSAGFHIVYGNCPEGVTETWHYRVEKVSGTLAFISIVPTFASALWLNCIIEENNYDHP